MAKTKLNPMDYPDTAIDDPENPELNDMDFKKARPFSEMFPEQHKALVRQGGRPRVAAPKVHIGFRLSQNVIDGIRASGEGYNARVEAVLRDALRRGRLNRKAG